MLRRVTATTVVLTALLGLGGLATAVPASACQPDSCPPPSPVCVLLDRVNQRVVHCIPVY
ncbi:MAG: hypothetical protein M3O32_01915 [Actinomycetota bacterium]|nr:hypothetical protein [Actinomycetota bacterium]